MFLFLKFIPDFLNWVWKVRAEYGCNIEKKAYYLSFFISFFLFNLSVNYVPKYVPVKSHFCPYKESCNRICGIKRNTIVTEK